MAIDPEIRVGDLLREHPQARTVLARHGMMCAGCKGLSHELLRHAARAHGVPVERLIKEIKAAIKSGS